MKATKEKKDTTNKADGEDGNIDQIRDILFGVQVRDFEKRFSELDRRFSDELQKANADNQKRFAKLEKLVEKEVASLSEKIYAEEDSRSAAVKGLEEDLKLTSDNLTKEISRLSDHNAKNNTKLRQDLVDLSESMVNLIQEKQKEMSVSLETRTEELQSSKADRKSLAKAFEGFAQLLYDEKK